MVEELRAPLLQRSPRQGSSRAPGSSESQRTPVHGGKVSLGSNGVTVLDLQPWVDFSCPTWTLEDICNPNAAEIWPSVCQCVHCMCVHCVCVHWSTHVTEVFTEDLLILVTEAGHGGAENLDRDNLGPLVISLLVPRESPGCVEVQVSGASSWWAEAGPMVWGWAVLGFPPRWGGETPHCGSRPLTLCTPGSQPSALLAPVAAAPPGPWDLSPSPRPGPLLATPLWLLPRQQGLWGKAV